MENRPRVDLRGKYPHASLCYWVFKIEKQTKKKLPLDSVFNFNLFENTEHGWKKTNVLNPAAFPIFWNVFSILIECHWQNMGSSAEVGWLV